MTSLSSPLKVFLISISIFFIIIFFTYCSDDNSPSQNEPSTVAEIIYEEIVKPQEERFNLFELLTSSMDTLSAMDSVLKVFLQDTSVEWGKVSKQGISIQYKNGIKGGILIDPLDSPDTTNFDLSKLDKKYSQIINKRNIIPGSKKTIFINPSYWERKKYADKIISNYRKFLPQVGFDDPVIYLNEEATMEKFTQLSDYGIIHFYSHGWPWPDLNNISKVYVQTGEVYSPENFNEKFVDDYKEGDIMIAFSRKIRNHVLLITPNFLAKYNNFKMNTPLIYGGFCFSDLGDWPQTMTNTAGASGYFGFDWAVRTNWNAWWNRKLIQLLADPSYPYITTTFGWMNNDLEKNYWADNYNKIVSIRYYGDSDLSLRELEYNRCSIEYRIQRDTHHEVTKTSGSVDSWDTYGDNQRDDVVFQGNLKGNKFSGDYVFSGTADTAYYTVEVTLNSDTTKVENFSLTMHKDQTLITGGDTKRIYDIDKSIKGRNIDIFTFSSSDEHVFRVVGENTCNAITSANSTIKEDVPSLGEIWYSNSTNNYCNEDSFIIIKFYTE